MTEFARLSAPPAGPAGPVRVVVNCAGAGTRLGLGTTKALIDVLGEPLLAWQLRMLEHVDDVVVVAGYQAEGVVELVRSRRPDAQVRINPDFATTGTASSLAIGAADAPGDVLSLDGDLLVHPEDLRDLLACRGARLGVAPPTSDEPVYVAIESRGGRSVATGFDRSGPGLEWTGLVRIAGEALRRGGREGKARGHVFALLEGELPIPVHPVRVREIDTPDDYERALEWFAGVADLLREPEPVR